MRLLIDTHVLIWWVQEPKKIRKTIRDDISNDENEVFVSAVSAWEIANKVRIGKLRFAQDILDSFEESIRLLNFEHLPVSAKHAVAGAKIEAPHKDPFDRMLAGQALVEGMKLISADPQFKQLGVETVW